MIGIYLITNKINNKKYVGQSVDIKRRWNEHLRSGQPEKYAEKNERDRKTPIHLAMQKYGIENFELSVLEECKKEELDEREKYWIETLQTQIEFDKGYNISSGGQEHVGGKGQYHSQAKLTQEEVNEIKRLLRETDLSLTEINNLFPKVGKPMLSLIKTGKNWRDENEEYPIRKFFNSSKGSKNPRAKLGDEVVLEMRKKYAQGVSEKEIKQEYSKKYNISEKSVSYALMGLTYSHLLSWVNFKEE